MVDVVDGLGRGKPSLVLGVIDGRLNTLSVVLREESEVFASDFYFSPKAFVKHRETYAGIPQDSRPLAPFVIGIVTETLVPVGPDSMRSLP